MVMGGDTCSEGRGFESQLRILDGHLFTFICCKIVMLFEKTIRSDKKFLIGSTGFEYSFELQRLINSSFRYLKVEMHDEEEQCDQIWRNCATLAKVYKSLANF